MIKANNYVFKLSFILWLHFSVADELLLSAIQPTFEYGGGTWSNCSLLHKLLITGQEEQVVSRRGELDRDLLSTTCEDPYGVTKVRCRVGLKCRLEIRILFTNRNRKQRTSDV